MFAQVISMNGPPLDSLYHCVHSVYAPVLLRDEAGRQGLSGELQVSTLPRMDENRGCFSPSMDNDEIMAGFRFDFDYYAKPWNNTALCVIVALSTLECREQLRQ